MSSNATSYDTIGVCVRPATEYSAITDWTVLEIEPCPGDPTAIAKAGKLHADQGETIMRAHSVIHEFSMSNNTTEAMQQLDMNVTKNKERAYLIADCCFELAGHLHDWSRKLIALQEEAAELWERGTQLQRDHERLTDDANRLLAQKGEKRRERDAAGAPGDPAYERLDAECETLAGKQVQAQDDREEVDHEQTIVKDEATALRARWRAAMFEFRDRCNDVLAKAGASLAERLWARGGREWSKRLRYPAALVFIYLTRGKGSGLKSAGGEIVESGSLDVLTESADQWILLTGVLSGDIPVSQVFAQTVESHLDKAVNKLGDFMEHPLSSAVSWTTDRQAKNKPKKPQGSGSTPFDPTNGQEFNDEGLEALGDELDKATLKFVQKAESGLWSMIGFSPKKWLNKQVEPVRHEIWGNNQPRKPGDKLWGRDVTRQIGKDGMWHSEQKYRQNGNPYPSDYYRPRDAVDSVKTAPRSAPRVTENPNHPAARQQKSTMTPSPGAPSPSTRQRADERAEHAA